MFGRNEVSEVAASSAFSISNKRRMVSPHTANMPLANQPYTTNGQWNGTEKISSEIHRLWPHSLAATVIHSSTAALISKKNDQGKPFSLLYRDGMRNLP